MHIDFFKGRANMRGQDDKGKKKAKTSKAERKRRKTEEAEKRRKFSRFPVGYPIPPKASMAKKRYRHTCTCGGTFVADSQEAFCQYCGSNARTVTDVLENS